MIPLALLPNIGSFIFKGITFSKCDDRLALSIESSSSFCACPKCKQHSHSIHSHYERKLDDLAWGNSKAHIILNTKKFYCTNPCCIRKIFTERFKNEINPYGRTTSRFRNRLTNLALFHGANPISKCKEQLNFSQSSSTLLRWSYQYDKMTLSSKNEEVRVLGVDDWAIRKGMSYGTILVNLETSSVIGLLKGRGLEPLKSWLEEHPEIEIISRDRSSAYSSAAKKGAPQAIQIADRWHLIKNFSTSFEHLLTQNKFLIDQASLKVKQPSTPSNSRKEKFEQVKKLQAEGLSAKQIMEIVDIKKTTVYKYFTMKDYSFKNVQISKVEPYRNLLIKLWKDGEHSPKKLWETISKKGYDGDKENVYKFIKRHVKPHFKTPRMRSVQQVLTLLLIHTKNLSEEDYEYRQALFEAFPAIKEVRLLYFQLINLLVKQNPDQLDSWVNRLKKLDLKLMSNFIIGIESDYQAIKNAATYLWSNGPVEGQVNKLKLIKRMGYGRASLELLEKKMFIRNAS